MHVSGNATGSTCKQASPSELLGNAGGSSSLMLLSKPVDVFHGDQQVAARALAVVGGPQLWVGGGPCGQPPEALACGSILRAHRLRRCRFFLCLALRLGMAAVDLPTARALRDGRSCDNAGSGKFALVCCQCVWASSQPYSEPQAPENGEQNSIRACVE